MEAWTQGKLTHIKVGSCKHKPESSIANDTGFLVIPHQERSLRKEVATVGPNSVAIDGTENPMASGSMKKAFIMMHTAAAKT